MRLLARSDAERLNAQKALSQECMAHRATQQELQALRLGAPSVAAPGAGQAAAATADTMAAEMAEEISSEASVHTDADDSPVGGSPVGASPHGACRTAAAWGTERAPEEATDRSGNAHLHSEGGGGVALQSDADVVAAAVCAAQEGAWQTHRRALLQVERSHAAALASAASKVEAAVASASEHAARAARAEAAAKAAEEAVRVVERRVVAMEQLQHMQQSQPQRTQLPSLPAPSVELGTVDEKGPGFPMEAARPSEAPVADRLLQSPAEPSIVQFRETQEAEEAGEAADAAEQAWEEAIEMVYAQQASGVDEAEEAEEAGEAADAAEQTWEEAIEMVYSQHTPPEDDPARLALASHLVSDPFHASMDDAPRGDAPVGSGLPLVSPACSLWEGLGEKPTMEKRGSESFDSVVLNDLYDNLSVVYEREAAPQSMAEADEPPRRSALPTRMQRRGYAHY